MEVGTREAGIEGPLKPLIYILHPVQEFRRNTAEAGSPKKQR